MTIKLAMHTWPYASNPRWLPAYTLEETLKRIKAIGYDAVEIGAASPHVFTQSLSEVRRKDVAKMLRDYELHLLRYAAGPRRRAGQQRGLAGGRGTGMGSAVP